MIEPKKKPRLLDQVRDRIRSKHYSIRTEESYIGWIKRFIFFHDKKHPQSMGSMEVEAFLTYLAVDRNVSASTQNQALSALVFLYRDILDIELSKHMKFTFAKKPAKLPVVLSISEVDTVLSQLRGEWAFIGRLLYGSGMRLMEVMRLRVKDIFP